MKNTDFTFDVIAVLNKQLTKRRLKSDLRTLDNSFSVKILSKLTTALSKQQLKKDLKQLNDLYVQVGANVTVDKDTITQLQKRIKELQNTISDIEVSLKVSKSKADGEVESARKTVQAKANKAPIGFDIEVKRSKAIADIEYLGKRFSKLFTNVAAKQKYENILTSAYSISDETQLKYVRNQIAAFTSELKANGLASQSLHDKWRNLFDRGKNLLSAASIITTIFTQVKQAVSTFLQLDTAMTNLYKTTDDITSRDQFSGLLTKWNKLAQNLAVTTKSLIDSMETWSKIGFDLDMSEQLAEITAIFEKTTEISNEKATSTLISAAQAFTEIDDLGVNDYIKRVEAVGNKINAIGNKYAIDSEGIADGLLNASAVLKDAGNDLNETIALITTTNKIYQNPEEGSNMLKVVSMRLRGQIDALKEMGEDVESVSTDIAEIQQQIYELTGNKVNIFEDEDTLKSTYQMMLEIGEVFDSLSDNSQADLLEVMFGKQRASAGNSLLLNYEELEKVKNDSINAANSMAEEYGKYMESAEAHITIFKEKLIETYSTFMSGNLIKYTADIGNGILDLINSTDLLKHGILAVLAINIGKGITSFGTAIAATVRQMNMLGSALQQVKNLPTDKILREKTLVEIGEATKNLTEKNLKLLLSNKNLEQSDKISILQKHDLTKEEAKAKLEKMGLITTTNAQSAANVTEATTTFTLKNAMTSLKTSIIGVGTSIKAAFFSNPIGFILTGITTIISVATTVISNHNQKLEEMHERAKEAADTANIMGDEISALASKYISLSEAVKTDEGAKEDLVSTQTELLKKLGLEGKSIDDLIAKYGSLSKAIKQASIDSLQEAQIDLIAGVDAAKEDLLSVSKDNFWGNRNIISTTGKDAVKAFEELEKAGIVNRGAYGSGGGALVLTGDNTVNGALENFQKLEDALKVLRDSEAFTVEELSQNPLYQALYGRYSEMKEGVNSYRSAIDNLNENLSQQTMLTALQGQELPKTKETFNTFKQELIDTAVASEQFIGTEKEIADAINNYLSTVPEFKDYYSIPLENELDKADTLLKQSSSFTSLDLSTYKDQIGDIQSSISTLRSALDSFNAGTLDASAVLNLMQQFPDLVPFIDLTADGFGHLSEGLSNLISRQPDTLIEDLEQLKASLTTDAERQQVELLIDSLQRLSSYGDSGIESYATAIGSTWNNTANVIAGVTTQFESLAKVQETVADGLTITATKAAELAKMYPEILTNAEVSANGQITLNEDVVQNILDGDQSVINAQITKLEADKAELLAKKDFAEAQLKIVEQVGEGEGQISREVALYKLEALNKQLQAVADANSEEDRIVAETAENMAGNMHKFNVGVKNVARNTSSNMGKAARAMADSLSRNSINAQESLGNIQKKAWDVADSIKNMPTGKRGGNLRTYGGGGSTQVEEIDTTIDTGNFETRRASYHVTEIDFEEFQSQLETEIQGYLNAISNIDSQIDVLKNLQGTFAENGGIGGHGYADQVKQLEKEREELNNSLNDASSASAKETAEFSEELSWTEKLVNRVSSALDKLKDKVSNTYIGWSARNHSLSKAMEKTKEAINVQQQAYEQYMQKAASVGLSQEYVHKIQNGSLDIETITDESLADRIKEYETWYDKASDCSDAIEDLKTQLAELARQKFDNINTYFSGLMETTEKSISRLEIKEKNTFKAPKAGIYNSLYDETRSLINYNTQRVQQLEDALDSAVNSGYIESGSEAWRDMYNEILEVRNATEEYKLQLQDISRRSYEALLKPIEQELAKLEQRKNVIENMQDRLALQGYAAAKGLYERQLRDSESRLKTLKEQAARLQQNMQDAVSKGLETGSDDWVDMRSAIDDNVISVMELENSIIELNSAIRDLEWDKFDRFQNSISRITGESDFMIDMFGKDDTYGEDGKLTEEGSAVIGLHAQNYFAYREQARAYKDEVNKINKELENDSANATLIDRKNDLIDAYQNAAKAAHDEYEAVIELGKDGYQAQIDSIQELIDAKKKQLEADKSLYEYQKNIAEKTKNIADIQKQLSALSHDDSEENRAKIQKLKADLTDAQKDLEDTQYDNWYSDRQDMLDRLAEEYAVLISEQSRNEQEVFQEMIGYVNANAQEIQDTISSTAQEWDYVLSHGIDAVLEPGINGITDIGQNIYREILRLYELNERMYRVSADLADLGVTDYGLETTISDETTARNFIERLYNGLLGRHSEEDGLHYWMNKLMNGETVQEMLEGFLNSDEYKALGKSASDTILDFYQGLLGRPAETAGYQYWMDQYNSGMSLSEIGSHGFLYSDEFLSRDQWMRMLDARPSDIDYTAFAKRGLIPVNTNSLINTGFIPQIHTPDYPELPNITRSGNTSFGDINIHIPIEHVADYNDFVSQIQRDGKFEKMIQDMTIGQLAGKNRLSKNSYKWP